MTNLSLSLLGSFQAWTGNGQQHTFRTIKERALLAYLAVEHERRHSREELAMFLWPDRSEGVARNNLRQALYGLRQAVGEVNFEQIFSVTAHELQIVQPQKFWVDVVAFQVHLKAFQAHRKIQPEPCAYCLQHLHDAVELYRGSFLEDILLETNYDFQDWATCHREQYHRLQMQALESLVDIYESMRDNAQAVLFMLRLVEMDAENESQYRRLMRLMAHSGHFNAALEQYEICRRQAKRQGRQPEQETAALAEQIQLGRFSIPSSHRIEPQHNLPEQLTTFVGREMELAWLARALENPLQRLVSVVGPGGVGKTRLVIQAVLMNIGLFPDGAFYIPLASIPSIDFLVDFISRQIGLSFSGEEDARATLFEYLRMKRLLLVFDNFEHLLEGRELLLELLQIAPFIKALVTSREQLHTQAEFLMELEGLPYLTEGEQVSLPSNFSRVSTPAMYLLLERAGRVRQEIAASSVDGIVASINDPSELEGALKICRLVSGLPLGIELAASWARDFSLAHIAEEIQSSLEFLQSSLQDLPDRHRSLRASFEYSWDLLTESEQEVFGKLSVFPGSFTAAAAHAVTGAGFPWLLRLIDKSLVRRFSYGRYDLHPLLRQFGGQKLRQFSRRIGDQIHQRHAQYFCAFLSERCSSLKSAAQVEALQEVEVELENIRAAWEWAVEHQAFDLLQGAAEAFFYFNETRSRWREGADLFGKAVSYLMDSNAAAGLHRHTLAYLLACQGWFSCRLTRFEQANDQVQESLRLLEGANASFERNVAHFVLGFLYVWMGWFEEAWLHLKMSLRLAEQISDSWSAAWSKELLAEIAFESGQTGLLLNPFLDALNSFEEIGDRRGICRSLNYLGNIALAAERFQEAQGYFEKIQSHLEQIGDIWGSAGAYNKLG